MEIDIGVDGVQVGNAFRVSKFRSGALEYDVDLASQETGLECRDQSLTQQHQKDEADINVLVERFGLVGKMPDPGSIVWPWTDVDVSEAQDLSLADMLEIVGEAGRAFHQLPAKVRGQFDNDPAKFETWLVDPENRDQAIKYGLVMPPPVVDTPRETPVASESGNGSVSS